MIFISKNCVNSLLVFLIITVLFSANFVFAKTDLSISETDITFSKDNPQPGDTIKIYARVFNTGDVDISGHVVFSDNGKEIGDPQPISVKSNTYDDVFIDWKVTEGNHNIKAEIVGANPQDEILDNNSSTKKDFLVDIDTDGDGIKDAKDPDIDGDGLANEEEVKIGTSPQKADTDGDGVNDKIDAFPKDSTEIKDTDGDALGDVKDLDDDGDGVFDDEEIKLGIDSTKADTDNDSLTDKQEISIGTNPLKADTDGDGAPDSKDAYPLDASKWQAGLLGSLSGMIAGKEYILYMGIPAFFVLLLLFRRKKRGQ